MILTSIKNGLQRLQEQLGKIRKLSFEDVWDVEITSLSALQGIWVRTVRVITLVFKGFKEDECSMHASALTFSTLMAIVPVLALCLSMARGLGDADTAKLWIQDRVETWTQTFKTEEVNGANESATETTAQMNDEFVQSTLAARINNLVEQGFEKVDNINFARLGTVGLILLIWMVIEVLGRVERSFNRVWGIAIGRTVWRRFTDYLSVLLIMPVLIVAAASVPITDMLTRFLNAEIAEWVQRFVESGLFKNLTVVSMTTLTLAFFIMFMPNTRVSFKSGIAGGFVAALLFLLWLWICAMIQVGVGRAGKIYGSFAIVPILLFWVHMSWQIVLFGAEVAFAVQNYATFKMEQSARDANIKARMTLALSIIVEAARAMTGSAPRFEVANYAKTNRVPVRFLNAVIEELVQAGYLAQLSEKAGAFALLKVPSSISVSELMNVVMSSGAGPEDLGLISVDSRITDAVNSVTGGVDVSLHGANVESLI